MLASNFKESNHIFGPPKGTTEDEIQSLYANIGVMPEQGYAVAITVAYRPTQDEMQQLAEGGKVYITLMSRTMPPIMVRTDSPFDDGTIYTDEV